MTADVFGPADGIGAPGVDAALDALSAAIDTLSSMSLQSLAPTAAMHLLADLEMQRNRLAGVDQRVLAAVADSGAVAEAGATSLPDLVSSLTRCSRRVARARVSRSVDLGPRRSLTGQPLAAIHPLTAAAVAAGAVSEEQSAVIVSALGRIGPDAEPSAFEVAEQFMITAAAHQPPEALAESGRWVLAHLDPAGLEPREATVQRTRYFSLSDSLDADGGIAGKGRFTPEAAAALRAVLGPLATPRPTNDSGDRDVRSAGQRNHDALLEVALRLLRCGDIPDSGGVPASVLVQLRADGDGAVPDGLGSGSGAYSRSDAEGIDAEPGVEPPRAWATTLVSRLAGVGQLGDGQLISLEQVRLLVDECEITTVVLGASGGILSYGRERRIASPAQRRALAARDGGCCFPGCTRPPAWTQAHHVREWLDGGPTNIDNLCLLCAHHHRAFAVAGWQVIMRDGVPSWIPPAWLDQHRREVRNTARHLTAIDFGPLLDDRNELQRT